MKISKYILFCVVVCILTISCQNESANPLTPTNSGEAKLSYCDSLYNFYFQNDPRLLKMEDIVYSNLDSLNQLIQISDSARGHFILHFDSDSMPKSLPLRSRFLYLDKHRRHRNPKVGTYLRKNYVFRFSEDQNKTRIYSTTRISETIHASNLLDTVRAIVVNDFMADSSTVAELSYITFKYPTPIDLQDFKDLAIFTTCLNAELRDTLCAQYDEKDPMLKFKIEKLAYLIFEVWYDWADSFEYINAEIMKHRRSSVNDSIEVGN